ncbi:fibronectin type III domain-containing protein [Candidatus Woesearchaeota archaeon]|nr:fibronectin type III domain-containing protein [Candidatus Woesearchaeota archaeon]
MSIITIILALSLILSIGIIGAVMGVNIEQKNDYVTAIGDNNATIEFITQEKSSSTIYYAQSREDFSNRNYKTLSGTTLTKQHKLVLKDLQSGTKYYYRMFTIITEGSQRGRAEVSDNNGQYYSFTTTGTRSTANAGTQSQTNGVDLQATGQNEQIQDGKTIITFQTTIESITNITYGIGALTTNILVSATPAKTHTITLNTNNEKVYKYTITACASSNTCITTQEKTFSSYSTGSPTINATIPAGVNTNTITITGSTRAGITLNVFVNGEFKTAKKVDSDGRFSINNINLVEGVNTIILETADSFKQKKTFVTLYDSTPPGANISWTPDVSITKETKIRVNGTISEKTMIKINNETIGEATTFDKIINLQPGENKIKIELKDAGGNEYAEERIITYDNTPLRFEKTNLNNLRYAYNPEIKIIGKLNKKASVSAKINGKVEKTAGTNDNGEFSMTVPLTGKTRVDVAGNTASAQLNTGLKNDVELYAADSAGYTATTPKQEVVRTLCGGGTIIVKRSNVMPNILLPRLIMKGIPKITQTVTFETINKNIKILSVKAFKPTGLSDDVLKDYDQEWFDVGNVKLRRPDKGAASITLNINAPDPAKIDGATTSEKERALSENRKGECKGAGGCFKGIVFLDIEYQQTQEITTTDPTLDAQLPDRRALPREKQTECFEYEVEIDHQIDPGIISDSFLKRTVTNLDHAIEGLEHAEEQLQTATEVGYYACFATRAWELVDNIREKYACEFSPGLKDVLKSLSGTKTSVKDIASIGKCDEAFGGQGGDDKKLNSCKSCQDVLEHRESVKDYRRNICYRVTGPSAPTFQTYIRANSGKALKEVAVKDGKYLTGSSCSFGTNNLVNTQKISGAKGVDGIQPIAIKTDTDYESISKLYETNGETYCKGLHPADPKCCAAEYDRLYGPVCRWFSKGADWFNELDHSLCLGAQNSGNLEKVTNAKDGSTSSGLGLSCRASYKNKGLCDEGALSATPEYFTPSFTGLRLKEPTIQDMPEIIGRIVPIGANSGILSSFATDETAKEFEITLGGAARGGFTGTTANAGEASNINSELQYVPLVVIPTEMFGEKRDASINAIYNHFSIARTIDQSSKFCDTVKDGGCNKEVATAIYDQVKQRIGNKDTTFIIRPDDGIITSLQCGYVTGIYSNVNTVKRTMTAVRDCLKSVQLTGDADPGICKEVITETACNLLWELVRCGVPTKTVPGKGGSPVDSEPGLLDYAGAGIGSVIEGFRETQRDIISEDGQDEVFKAMFLDKKLQNAACLYAFTGEWDFNMEGLINAKLDSKPAKTIGFLPFVRKEFISFDPTTKPKGLTTWTYRTAPLLTAGRDITVQLELVCSDSIQCDPSQGYPGGKCDCYAIGEKKVGVPLSKTSLRKGEQLGTTAADEIIHTIQAGEGGSNYRYDKAVLSWQWVDERTGEARSDNVVRGIITGATDAPIQCKFDIFAGVFRCDSGIDDYNGARFGGDITLKNAVQGVFTLGQKINFNIPVQLSRGTQQDSSRLFTQDTKWLIYTIYDHNNNIVQTNKNKQAPLMPIQVNHEGGLQEYNLNSEGTSQEITLDKDVHFRTRSSNIQVEFNNLNAQRRALMDTQGTIEIVGGSIQTNEEFLIKIKNAAVNLKYSIYSITGGNKRSYDDDEDNAPDFWTIGGQLQPTTGTSQLVSNQITFKGIKITFPQQLLTEIPASRSIFIRVIPPTAVANACEQYETTPAQWKAVFEIYDSIATNAGGGYVPNYHQRTLDPVTDEEQEKTVLFKAVCSQNYAGQQSGSTIRDCAIGQNSAPCWCGDTSSITKTENCGTGVNNVGTVCGYNIANEDLRECVASTELAIIEQPQLLVDENIPEQNPANSNIYEVSINKEVKIKTKIITLQNINLRSTVNGPIGSSATAIQPQSTAINNGDGTTTIEAKYTPTIAGEQDLVLKLQSGDREFTKTYKLRVSFTS